MNIKKLSVFVVAVWVLAGSPAEAKNAPAPRAVFAATTLSFPTVVDGVVVTREFSVKNVGSADLRIDKVKTG